MIYKTLFLSIIIPTLLAFGYNEKYSGGSLAPVIIAGTVVKNEDNIVIQKYKRKECPVCKGTGKYLSGDGIKMVDCGYCEVEK